MGAHPLFSILSRRWLNPIKLAYSPSPPDNGLGQYVSSPGNRAYCYAELAVSSLAMAVIIANCTHFSYPRRDGQAELAVLQAGNLLRERGLLFDNPNFVFLSGTSIVKSGARHSDGRAPAAYLWF